MDQSRIGPPPAPVRAMLEAHGFKPKDVEGVEFWDNGATTCTWAEAIKRLSDELLHARQVAAIQPKQFWRTSEFWTAAVSVLGLLGTGAGMLAGQLDWVPPEHRDTIGSALMGVSTVAAGLYARARMIEKTITAAEKSKATMQGGGNG